MKFDILVAAIAAGLFWGAVVIHRWPGEKLRTPTHAFKWFAYTAIIMALGYYWLHGISN